jgi:hypothetical protein
LRSQSLSRSARSTPRLPPAPREPGARTTPASPEAPTAVSFRSSNVAKRSAARVSARSTPGPPGNATATQAAPSQLSRVAELDQRATLRIMSAPGGCGLKAPKEVFGFLSASSTRGRLTCFALQRHPGANRGCRDEGRSRCRLCRPAERLCAACWHGRGLVLSRSSRPRARRSRRPLAPGSLPARQAGQGTATHAPPAGLERNFLVSTGA